MELAQLKEFSIAIPSQRVAFDRISKCASQSIMLAFMQAVKARNGGQMVFAREWIEPGPGWRIATLVRDPADRLLSGYTNRIAIDRMSIEPMPGVELGMPLPDFVDAVCALPDSALDLHFKPQSHFARRDYTAILKFENIPGCWDKYRDSIPSVGLPPLQHRNASKRRDVMSPELRRKIFNRYAADAARFGYEA